MVWKKLWFPYGSKTEITGEVMPEEKEKEEEKEKARKEPKESKAVKAPKPKEHPDGVLSVEVFKQDNDRAVFLGKVTTMDEKGNKAQGAQIETHRLRDVLSFFENQVGKI